MKKILVILLLQMAIAFNVFAQGEGDRIVNPTWKLSSGALSPTVSTWTLTLPATTFSPSIITPLIIGGADTISTLTYKTTTGVGKTGARHIFQVGTNGATEAMTILNDGKIGIGTTSPSVTLDVEAAQSGIRVNSTTGTNSVNIKFINTGGDFNIGRERSTGGGFLVGSSAYAAAFDARGTYPMQFGVNGAVAMTILNNGFMGIGTTSPTSNLHVMSAAGTNPSIKIGDADLTNPFSTIESSANVTGGIGTIGTAGGGLFYSGYSMSDQTALLFRGLIGSTDPADATPAVQFRAGKLSGTTGGNLGALETAYQFSDWTGGTHLVTILAGGNVGIGTTTPYAQLSQVGTLPIWYATDSDFNLHRTSLAFATDTSAIKIDASVTEPTITVKNTTGNGFALSTVTAGGASFNGNVGISVTAFPTTLAKGLTIANGTAPTVKANSASLYVVLGEMWVYDSTGTATKISPHNDAGDWVFDSYNAETGERTYINMITLAETLEELSGKTLIVRENVLQEVQKKDAYEEYDSTITISKKVTKDEATSLVIDTVYTETADTTQLVEYYTYDDKTEKVEKKTKYKIDKAPNYVSEWKIKDGYKLNETNGDFEKTTSTKKANRLKSNAKIKNGKYYIINLAKQ